MMFHYCFSPELNTYTVVTKQPFSRTEKLTVLLNDLILS